MFRPLIQRVVGGALAAVGALVGSWLLGAWSTASEAAGIARRGLEDGWFKGDESAIACGSVSSLPLIVCSALALIVVLIGLFGIVVAFCGLSETRRGATNPA